MVVLKAVMGQRVDGKGFSLEHFPYKFEYDVVLY